MPVPEPSPVPLLEPSSVYVPGLSAVTTGVESAGGQLVSLRHVPSLVCTTFAGSSAVVSPFTWRSKNRITSSNQVLRPIR
jgi:hypothetical protein